MVMEETYQSHVSAMFRFTINGVSLPEGGYNALTAGLYGVPVVFAAAPEHASTSWLRRTRWSSR
jgi:D-aminopeptidase